MKPTRKSTEKEILAAVLSICFTAYIIIMVILEIVSPEHAEKLWNFISLVTFNVIFWGLSFCFFAGAFLYLIAK